LLVNDDTAECNMFLNKRKTAVKPSTMAL